MTVDPELIAVLAIVFFATLSRSTFGFGDALIAMPLLTLAVKDIAVATPLVALVSFVVAVTIVAQDWRRIHLRSAGLLVFAAMWGVPLGLVWLREVDERIFKGFLAVLVLAFSSYCLLRPRMIELKSDRWAPLFGFVAGVLGSAYNTGGPPLVIYGTLRHWSNEHFRATLQGYFLPIGVLILSGHWSLGLWTPKVLTFFVASLPVVFLAILAGRLLNRRVQPELFQRLMFVGLLFVGATLLYSSVR